MIDCKDWMRDLKRLSGKTSGFTPRLQSKTDRNRKIAFMRVISRDAVDVTEISEVQRHNGTSFIAQGVAATPSPKSAVAPHIVRGPARR